LAAAYEAACDELTERHGISPKQLGRFVDPMVSAMTDFYTIGQHDKDRLKRYAVSRTLVVMRGPK